MSDLEALKHQILAQCPTEQQSNAIFADELEFLLRAAPGSGKTWTSCRRFIWRGANRSYSSGGLALLSFTNAAIKEFQTATIKVGRRDLLSEPNYVGTFDAFVERFIITPFGHLIAGSSKRPKLFIEPRPGDRANKKLQAWYDSNGHKQPIYAWEIVPYPEGKKIAFKTSKGVILGPSSGASEAVRQLMSLGYYTHGQRVYWAVILLAERKHIASVLARRFPEIIVDEAQDSNAWLLILLNLLHKNGSKITLIGDPDQCIYEFSMADVTALPAMREKWSIPEKPLSKSFRCSDPIANAVKNISGNADFTGCGSAKDIYSMPYIYKEGGNQFEQSLQVFQQALRRSGISDSSSAILCRGHSQLEAIRGESHYGNLQGLTKELARASFLRDCRRDYKLAFSIVASSICQIIDDLMFSEKLLDVDESDESMQVKLAVWHFVKSKSGLPEVSLDGRSWIDQLRERLGNLIVAVGKVLPKNFNNRICMRGLKDGQTSLPLFEINTQFPAIRQETIHQVKGEGIDGVLVIGSTKFWNSVVSSIERGENSEDRRLAYVAMTRTRHLLVVGLPATHFDKHSQTWIRWGFNVLL